jgi:hypothetical protein
VALPTGKDDFSCRRLCILDGFRRLRAGSVWEGALCNRILTLNAARSTGKAYADQRNLSPQPHGSTYQPFLERNLLYKVSNMFYMLVGYRRLPHI